MWSDAALKRDLGLISLIVAVGGALSLAALGALGLVLGISTGSGAGVGGGVGGSSTIFVRGFRGALSLEPSGLPRFLATGAGLCSTIVELSGICSATCSLCSLSCGTCCGASTILHMCRENVTEW